MITPGGFQYHSGRRKRPMSRRQMEALDKRRPPSQSRRRLLDLMFKPLETQSTRRQEASKLLNHGLPDGKTEPLV